MERPQGSELRLTRDPLAAVTAPRKMCVPPRVPSQLARVLTLAAQQEHPVRPHEQPGNPACRRVSRLRAQLVSNAAACTAGERHSGPEAGTRLMHTAPRVLGHQPSLHILTFPRVAGHDGQERRVPDMQGQARRLRWPLRCAPPPQAPPGGAEQPHAGYIRLELPVFHVGYFKNIIAILQCVCKTCAHVMVPEDERRQYLRRFRSPQTEVCACVAARKRYTHTWRARIAGEHAACAV